MDGHEGLAVDLVEPEYLDPEYRQQNFGHIQKMVEIFFLLQDADEAYHEGQARGLPIGVINAPEDLLVDEHLRARSFFVAVEQPTARRRSSRAAATVLGVRQRPDPAGPEPGRAHRRGARRNDDDTEGVC